MTRDQRQKGIEDKWVKAKGLGGVEAATGFGKTRIGINCIRRTWMLRRASGKVTTSVLVVTPSVYLKHQWEQQLPSLPGLVITVRTVQSMISRSYTGEQVDLLILDEAHRYTSTEFSVVFQAVTRKHLLWLTATLPMDMDRRQILLSQAPLIDSVSLAECLSNGWVSQFTVYNLLIPPGNVTKTMYESASRQIQVFLGTFGYDFDLSRRILRDKRLAEHWAKQLKWDVKRVAAHAANAERAVRERKKLLYEAPELFETACKLIRKYDQSRIITFSEASSMADRLAGQFPDESVTYHSKVKHPARTNRSRYMNGLVKQFIDGKYRLIHTVKAFNEGMDVQDVDMSIKTSYTSSILQSLQRTGRVIRHVEGKYAYEINLVLEGTQSEKWLQRQQEKTPNVLWVDSMEDLPVTSIL